MGSFKSIWADEKKSLIFRLMFVIFTYMIYQFMEKLKTEMRKKRKVYLGKLYFDQINDFEKKSNCGPP